MLKNINDFQKKYDENEKIVLATAYDSFTALVSKKADVDAILVGDSLGMTAYGAGNTHNVTLKQMCDHIRAVRTVVSDGLIIGDMPWLTYHGEVSEAVKNAGELIKAGSNAVKLEGGKDFAQIQKAIVRAGIPVMGHIGLLPQSFLIKGGYKVARKYQNVSDDARSVEKYCFATVLEAVQHDIAGQVTSELSIPTIGIGSGKECDGQVLVTNDLLGMGADRKPKFVRQYTDLFQVGSEALKKYVQDVKDVDYPDENEQY